MKTLFLYSVLLLSVILISCKKSTEPAQHSNKIYVEVKDENGQVIEGVGMHFYTDIFLYPPGYFEKPGSIHSVELSQFYFIPYPGDSVKLIWETNSETNNVGFELFRSDQGSVSTLISSYKTNNMLQGMGTTQNITHYSYFDIITAGRQYKYQLFSVDSTGIIEELDSLFVFSTIGVPTETALFQNYPNPFNSVTRIRFQFASPGDVLFRIMDINSTSTIKTLIDTNLAAGIYSVMWDGTNDNGDYVTSNIYSYRLIKDGTEYTRKLFRCMINPQNIKDKNCIPLVVTDSKGKIAINFNKFPVGEEFVWTDETANELGILTIPETLSLVFIKNGYQSRTEEVVLKEGKIVNLSVVLSAE